MENRVACLDSPVFRFNRRPDGMVWPVADRGIHIRPNLLREWGCRATGRKKEESLKKKTVTPVVHAGKVDIWTKQLVYKGLIMGLLF